MKILVLLGSHVAVFAVGFAVGIFVLPILTAPPAPSDAVVQNVAEQAAFTGQFRRDLTGSDFLHWGEGELFVSSAAVGFDGELAPGPDYKLYLVPQFVQNEAEFEAIKAQAVQIGDVRTFDNFLLSLPDGIDPAAFNTAVVWCESFGEFISAAQYRE